MSLFRTAARASVATRVIGSTHRRQQQRWATQDAAAGGTGPQRPEPVTAADDPAPQAPPSSPSLLDQLTQLGQLRDAGVLTDAEFDAQKHRLLAGS